MATAVTVTSNYAGKEAGAIIGASFKEADTLGRGLIDIYPNINNTLNMRKISYTDGTTAYSCGHTPAGAIVLSEKTLTPVKLKNDFDVCKEDFRATWSEDLLGESAANVNSPSDIMEAIQVEVLSSTAELTDNKIWNGDSVNPDEWDGFLKLFGADANVIKAGVGLAKITAPITSANVLSTLALVTAGIPYSLRRKDVKYLISPDVADAYTQLLISNGAANGLGGNANTGLVYGRYTLEVVNGLPDNTFVVYEKKNLVFGTGLAGDHNQLSLIDEDEIGLLTGKVRGKMVYNGGCQYFNSEDIVWYLSTTI